MEGMRGSGQDVLAAIDAGTFVLGEVPEWRMTQDAWMRLVSKHPGMLDQVPDGMKTAEMCAAAVGREPFALQWVPDRFMTRELCLEAVRRNGFALAFVPEGMRTADMCWEAAGAGGKDGGVQRIRAEDVPEAVKAALAADMRRRLAEEKDAAARRAMAEKYMGVVPDGLKSEDFCLACVSQNGFLLRLVPMRLKTAAVCRAALESHGGALAYVPGRLKTMQTCIDAVASCGWAVRFVPWMMRTPSFALKAMLAVARRMMSLPADSAGRLCRSFVHDFWGALPKEEAESFARAALRCGGLEAFVPSGLTGTLRKGAAEPRIPA